MALIGKIRKNSGAVLVLLALALASFVLMDIMGSNSMGGGGLFDQTTVGKIDGEKIDFMEFQKIENALYSGSQDVYGRREQLWNYLMEKAVVEREAKAAGLMVTDLELEEITFGTNLSPVIANNFRDPQTGGVNREQLNSFKDAIASGEINNNPQIAVFWAEQSKQIVKTRLQEKLNSMVVKAIYTPTWQAELNNQLNTETIDFDYVRVPFDAIEDGKVTLTDEDYMAYLKENKATYENKNETRIVKYAVIDVVASAEDTLASREFVASLVDSWKTATNDSTFVTTQNGLYPNAYSSKKDLFGSIQDTIGSMKKGDIYGPYIEGTNYVIAKLIDTAVLPDSVKARHILRSFPQTDPNAMLAARKSIDSIKNVITSGAGTFADVAQASSQDPGSAAKGGDLGTFAQGMMVPEFNNACFIGSTEGGLYTVQTQFGFHLIEVQKKIYNDRDPKYKVAYITKSIVPSEDTENKFYDMADELLSSVKDANALESAATSKNFQVQNTSPLRDVDYIIGTLGADDTSREIVKWAFKANKGDVSPNIYSYQDKVNYYTKNYVVVAVQDVVPAGLPKLENIKSALEPIVKNIKKGEMLAEQMSGKDLAAVASQFSAAVATATAINFNAGFIPELGAEPKVVAKAFGTKDNSVSKPVVGNAGVFMVQPKNRTAAAPADNILMLKSTAMNTARSQVNFRIIEALKKDLDVKDMRAKFF